MAADVARTALGSPSVSLDTSRSAARRVSCSGILSASCKTPSNPAQPQGPSASMSAALRGQPPFALPHALLRTHVVLFNASVPGLHSCLLATAGAKQPWLLQSDVASRCKRSQQARQAAPHGLPATKTLQRETSSTSPPNMTFQPERHCAGDGAPSSNLECFS